MKIALKDREGNNVGEVELSDELFGIEPNPNALHQVVRQMRAQGRAGTAKTKTRGEVRGGGAKPWRQKGTGRARAGSSRSPIWRGGGTTFGPRPRDYSFKVSKRVRKLAFCSALSEAARTERITVLQDFDMETPSTKDGVEVLNNLDLPGTVMVVVGPEDYVMNKSFRNISRVETFYPGELNTYDLLRFDRFLFFKGALDQLQGGGGK